MSNRKTASFDQFDSFDEFFKQAERKPGYWLETAKLEFTSEVLGRMNDLGVGKSALAKLLDVQPGMVTRLLSGRNNFELATMVRIARALECEFRCHLQPCGTKTSWIDVLNGEAQAAPITAWNPGEFGRIKKFQPTLLKYDTVTAAA